MTSGCLILPSIIDHNVMRLDWITLLSYRPLAGRYFFAAVPVQIFGIFLMIPIDPAVKQLLAGLLFTIPAVDVLSIIKLLQTPVVAALLLQTDSCHPVPWMKNTHDVSVINM